MLHNELVFLRALEAEDLEFLYALENDAALWTVSDNVVPISRYTLRQYLDNAAADWQEVRQLRLVICATDDKRAVGTVDLFDYQARHQRAGIGIALLPAEQGRGYAQAALQLVISYAHTTLHLHQLYCTIATDNVRSIYLFEKLGFTVVGVRKQWLRKADGWQDVLEYQCIV
ncbi:GNAT family N-acetyltransferase [Hymenobacter sp. BT186]|uniref:GNAT family N-acetyltransferase n=1 Tax=Hymenobacter telluris TaxID=2816474 RepID=A0A939EWI5_9BACT|nr:GNAT family protein [Hymenobacter telluris]MBO0357203.1 GNAT family N-acetyltransferase [Hymenobacter telluris]MBW3373229.1 GNAT family N-acetyltransferase [Hymenobacter norwichensis]